MSSAESLITPAPINTSDTPRNFQSRASRLALTSLSAILLFLSFAPFNLFFLAWIALVPWLLVVIDSNSRRASFFYGALCCLIFFSASVFWLWTATIPGMIATILILCLIWGVAAAL